MPRCLLCGPAAPTTPVAVRNGYRILHCARCGLVFVEGWERLRPLELFYGPDYFHSASPFGYLDYLADERLRRRNARDLLACLERVTPGRRLLDVGCAHGFFLAEARERGWVGSGVDIAAAAVRYAQMKLGLDVVRGDLEHIAFAPETFDVAALVGTIEHLPDPLATLCRAGDLLKRGGHLLITTVDIDGRFRSWEWKPPEHLFYFSFQSLARVLDAAGFQVLSRRTYWAWYGAAELAARLLRHWRLPGARWADGLGSLALRIPTNEMLVLARKP